MTKQKLIENTKASGGIVHGSNRHQQLINKYNSVLPLPRGYKVTLSDDWCDIFTSVMFIDAGLSSLVGRECGVEHHKTIFKTLGIWKGRVKPEIGDIIIFRWDGNQNGWADHIGIVVGVNADTVSTFEGNTLINGKRSSGPKYYKLTDPAIQGYARPRYSKEEEQSTLTIKKVNQHFIVKIPELRCFAQPNANGKIVETIKQNYVKNIDQTTENGGYVWGGWISSVDNKRRWTTIKSLDSNRVLTEIREGTIGHGGKTIQEYESSLAGGLKLGDIVTLKKDVQPVDFTYKVIGIKEGKAELIVHSIRVDTNDLN